MLALTVRRLRVCGCVLLQVRVLGQSHRSGVVIKKPNQWIMRKTHFPSPSTPAEWLDYAAPMHAGSERAEPFRCCLNGWADPPPHPALCAFNASLCPPHTPKAARYFTRCRPVQPYLGQGTCNSHRPGSISGTSSAICNLIFGCHTGGQLTLYGKNKVAEGTTTVGDAASTITSTTAGLLDSPND